MTRYLCDTNVVSELLKPPERRHPKVAQWASRLAKRQLLISCVSAAEAWAGNRTKPEQRALEKWAAGSQRFYGIDYATAKGWGLAKARAREVMPWPVNDAWQAAIAARHGLVVATRNVGDFRRFAVSVLDPWR